MSKHLSILWAILAAALYAVNAPVSKLLLQEATPTMMAAMLYLGAGIGMLLLGMARQQLKMGKNEQKLTRKDFPFAVGMIVLDIAAPICLMIGLRSTTSANASLLNNFGVTPKFCVKSNECRNRAKFICRRQRLDRLPPMSTT